MGIAMKLMFTFVTYIFIALLLTSCPSSIDNKASAKEPDYTIHIIWESDIQRPFVNMMSSDETGIYLYNYQEHDFTTVRLNKIDSETGKTLWTTDWFEEVSLDPPKIIDNHIYALLSGNVILCFDKKTGNQLARARIVFNNKNIWITSDYYNYVDHFYFGLGDTIIDDYYLARINIDLIAKDGDLQEQTIEAELLWKSPGNNRIRTRPLVYNDIVYCNTATLDLNTPVEMAGIKIHSKEMVFYYSFGGDGYYNIDHGFAKISFFASDNMLYYLGESLAAYNLKNYEKIYHIVFDINTPQDKFYGASTYLVDVTFYKNNIYYTNNAANTHGGNAQNIFCINKLNGKLIWSDIPKVSESLGTNPIIYDNKVFISHMGGIRVYDADTGTLIGVEKRIEGSGLCYNQLYGSTMITARHNTEYPNGQIIALDLRN